MIRDVEKKEDEQMINLNCFDHNFAEVLQSERCKICKMKREQIQYSLLQRRGFTVEEREDAEDIVEPGG